MQTSNGLDIIGLSNRIQSFFKLVGEGWRSKYQSIDILLRHLERRSKSLSTRRNFLQHIFRFCQFSKMNPDELVSLSKQEIEILVQSFCDRYNSEAYSRRTANNVLTVLRSFFATNGYQGSRSLNVEGYYTPKRYRKKKEYIPQKHEVYKMADVAGSLRNRAAILMTFSSGLRSSTLLALCYKDIKQDLIQGHSIICLPVYPEMKEVHPNACKNNLPYYSFISEEATKSLRLYLLSKRETFGLLKDSYPVLSSDYNQLSKPDRVLKRMTTRQLQKLVKQAAKDAGIEHWQYVTPTSLRKSFESVLRDVTYDGKHLDMKEQEFLMGHTLDGAQDNYFDSTKIEHIRFLYSRLNFQRIIIQDRFQHLRRIVHQGFIGSGVDPDRVIEEYVKQKKKMEEMFEKDSGQIRELNEFEK